MYSHVCVSHNTYQACHSSCTPMFVSITTHAKHTTHQSSCPPMSVSITTHTSLIMCSHVCVSHNTHQTHHSSCTPMFVSITTHQTHHSSCLPMPVSVKHTLNISLIMYSHVCVSYTTHQTHHSSCAPMFVSLTTHIKHITHHVLHVHFTITTHLSFIISMYIMLYPSQHVIPNTSFQALHHTNCLLHHNPIVLPCLCQSQHSPNTPFINLSPHQSAIFFVDLGAAI